MNGSFPAIKQRFVRIKEAEYATDFNFFQCNQVQVVHHMDRTPSICSTVESRCFMKDNISLLDDEPIMEYLRQFHCDIISPKYRGVNVF
ncbi:MAG: hypothetical protein K0M50_06150 [Prolixibacteraceae bacterium]|nr:hypothetical protein [Prolixibacteraceae bacterium]